jgi:hypothetical protein
LVGALVVLAGACAAAPVASAGTYDVVSCGAPGAGGINRAWQPEYGGYPPAGVAADPSSYVIADQCPSQLFISSAPPDGTTARFLTSGNWVLNAPAGNRITRLETWRFGVRLRTNQSSDPDPNTGGDQGDPWRVFARDEGAQLIGGVFGENCSAPAGSIGCSFGSDSGVSAASRAVYDINATRIAYAVSCETLGNCPRTINNTPIATIKLFGTRVTITDNVLPAVIVGGPLLAAGWRRPTETLTTNTSDSAGIRSLRLDMAGLSRRVTSACDFHLASPCPTRRSPPLAVPEGTPDGTHAARIVVEDAAGNATVIERTIAVDGTPPRVLLERTRGRTVVLSVSDAASGLAEATLQVRRNSSEPYRTPKTTFKNGRLRATLDRHNASKMELRVTARDNAGNIAQGTPTRLTATSAKVGRRFRRVRSGRVKVPFGRAATLRGRLTLSASQSFSGQTIAATASVRKRRAAANPVGSVVTDRHGRFTLYIPAGPSRTYRLSFAGSGAGLPTTRGVSVRVPATSTIRASRTRVPGAGRVRFSGRLRTRGQRIPGRGLVLVLQGRSPDGKWRTFADTRTNRRGRWRASYLFRGRSGSYPIRVRIRKQSGFPFELGYSRRLTVRVG